MPSLHWIIISKYDCLKNHPFDLLITGEEFCNVYYIFSLERS